LEGIWVILPRLIRETEEDKEAKSTELENNTPTWELYTKFFRVVITPCNRCNFLDMREIQMNILPADIWVEGGFDLKGDGVEGDWDVEEDFDAGKAHESNESVGSDVAAVAGEDSVELC
jgi:hypothetical protein